MAIFEKSSQSKSFIDDTEKLECTLENARNVNKHTEYVLRVQRGYNEEDKWTVSRRYRDFSSLHVSLQLSNTDLVMPPKKLIGNMQPSFVAERQIALQKYIKKVLEHQILALSLPVRSFLDPQNYPLSIAAQALQTVLIALRGDGQYELKGSVPDIGWRIRKHYFLVTESDSRSNCLLSWQNYGPDKHLTNKDLQTAFKSLKTMCHPHVGEILSMHTLETGAYVVRRIYENGSVRDMLYGTDYNKSYLSKYGNPKIRKPLTYGQIAHYGYQILQALKFLHDKGIPHGHIHPGNIAIDNQRAVLLEVENMLMGVSCLYRPHLLQLKRVSAAQAVDVYCFGRTLYELAFAEPLATEYCDTFPDGTPEDLESVLRLCLSSTSCKHGPPTVTTLLWDPFFTRVSLNGLTPSDTRSHLKFPLTLKDQLKFAVSSMEERLRNDQKLVRNAKREVRLQEILSSEVEMKKQKKRAKKRESTWKSTSSLADTVCSQSGSTASSPAPPTPPALPADTGGSHLSSAVKTNGNGDVSDGAGARRGAGTGSGRAALLQDICSFDRSRLAARNHR